LKNKKNFDSAFTASAISSFIYNKSKKKWLSHNKFINKWPRTQDLDQIYSLNNAAFISKREIYTKLKDRIGNKPLPIESYENPDEIFDIDNKKDFNNFKKKFINRI
jgi:CMP-N-acetylneuraminic acid synthetase